MPPITRKRAKEQLEDAAETTDTSSEEEEEEEEQQQQQQQQDIKKLVDTMLQDAGMGAVSTTKGGWCLRSGLIHIMTADGSSLKDLVKHHGPPSVYTDSIRCRHQHQQQQQQNDNDAATMKFHTSTSFRSLCRIVAGQQLAGSAAQAVWKRLVTVAGAADLTPTTVLRLANLGLEDHLRKPVGLSNAKALSIVDLAKHFQKEELTDTFLQTAPESEVREALLKVRGLGPWSCDMFLLFYLERANVVPIGDLGVRKGVARHFSLRGKGKNGSLCPKKDLELIHKTVAPFEPYLSLLSFYMWKAADTVDFYADKESKKGKPTKKPKSSKR